MHLLIGIKVPDISVYDAHHEQSHQFLRNGKAIYYFSTDSSSLLMNIQYHL
jgi:hypothetical protein